MSRVNILFLVWDACRIDAVREYAPTLTSLAQDNLWFENAITPAGYSLPAHASLFTGAYLHEHATFSRTHQFDSLPLVEELGRMKYTRYGVSANGFASPRYQFNKPFDTFYNTQGQIVYPDGLDIHQYVRQMEKTQEEFSLHDLSYLQLLRSALNHPHPVKSLVNVAAAGVSELSNQYPFLQKIPHPRFNRYHEFAYSPSMNTDVIKSILQQEATTRGPFFLFTNYMDTHHPYAPPKRLQREYCNRTFSYYELSELAELSHPWNYLERVNRGDTLSDETIENIRNLYRGEVRRADEHLGKLLQALEREGLREETIVVITADHGENLGETDWMGENRMGHECSASEQLLRVPLVIAHPALDAAEISEYVSIKDLSRLFTEGLEDLLSSNGSEYDPLVPEDGVVASQIPPPANPTLQERYPDLSTILERSLSVTYADGWKMVATSAGDRYCWYEGKSQRIEDAPNQVVKQAEENLSLLIELTNAERELTNAQVSQLDSLGYL